MTVASNQALVKPRLEFPVPVRSVQEGVSFLVLEECAGGHGLIIRRSSRYGRKLNRFWTVWAREWLLKLDVKYAVQVMIEKNSVRVVSELPAWRWIGAASHLLANIVPLGEPPMRMYYWKGREYEGYWKVHPHADLTNIIKGLDLPKALTDFYEIYPHWNSVHFSRYGIEREKCLMPEWEMRMTVELKVALACAQNGVPRNRTCLYVCTCR